jgi:hypothetical protein
MKGLSGLSWRPVRGLAASLCGVWRKAWQLPLVSPVKSLAACFGHSCEGPGNNVLACNTMSWRWTFPEHQKVLAPPHMRQWTVWTVISCHNSRGNGCALRPHQAGRVGLQLRHRRRGCEAQPVGALRPCAAAAAPTQAARWGGVQETRGSKPGADAPGEVSCRAVSWPLSTQRSELSSTYSSQCCG